MCMCFADLIYELDSHSACTEFCNLYDCEMLHMASTSLVLCTIFRDFALIF